MTYTTYNGFNIKQTVLGYSVTLPNTDKTVRYPFDLIESTDYMTIISAINNWIESNF